MVIAVYLSRDAGEQRKDRKGTLAWGFNGNNSTTGDDVKRKKRKRVERDSKEVESRTSIAGRMKFPDPAARINRSDHQVVTTEWMDFD